MPRPPPNAIPLVPTLRMLIPALAWGQQPGRCRPATIQKNQCIRTAGLLSWSAPPRYEHSGRCHAHGEMYWRGTALCRLDMPTARTKTSRMGDEHDFSKLFIEDEPIAIARSQEFDEISN